MVFSNLFFLFVFLPAFALCYVLATWVDRHSTAERQTHYRHKWSNAALVLFSLLFYAWGEPVYVLLMLGSVLINYIGGRIIEKEEKHRRAALIAGVTINLLILGTMKYLSFFVSQLIGIGVPLPQLSIGLPIGISFYTFQSISYLVDVYRQESKAQKRLMDLLLYISMFPQLIAGPIVRYGTVAEEINNRKVQIGDLSEGLMRFLQGLGKKVILANQLSEVSSQLLTGSSLTTTAAWIGILAFTLQIYFDFSGYSDMAIGIGRCLGFHFNENFSHPYCCHSITDFWRRWHISLGSFFRDYVYIPMGGNRRHQAINILVVWMLTGFWHGASWNFLFWGLYFGIIIMLEKYTLLRFQQRIPQAPLHLYSLLLVVVGWGIFYFEDFSGMCNFFESFFALHGWTTDFVSLDAVTSRGWLWVAAIVFCLPIRLPQRLVSIRAIWSAILLIISISLLIGATNNAFLYTRF